MRRAGAFGLAVSLVVGLAACEDTSPSGTPDVVDAADVADVSDTGDDALDAAEVGPVPEALAEDLEAALQEGFPLVEGAGIAAGVALGDGRWWASGAGLADVESQVPIAATDRFRVGSVTKTFTAAIVLQLVDEGALALDDAVDDLVPGFDLGPAITVEGLLTHTSGIYNFTDDPTFIGEAAEPAAPAEIVQWGLDHGRAFEPPGSDFLYSNTGYILLGMIIEAVEGRPYDEVLRERLLDPLGLEETYLDAFEALPGGTVTGYVDATPVTDEISMTWAWAAGGLVSTVSDLCRWADVLVRGDVLPEGLREAMLTSHVLGDGTETGYGLGVDLRRRAGVDVVGHTGSTLGFRGELFMERASGRCVAVLGNDFLAAPVEVSSRLWQVLAALPAD